MTRHDTDSAESEMHLVVARVSPVQNRISKISLLYSAIFSCVGIDCILMTPNDKFYA